MEHDGLYYKKDELDALDRMAVADTITRYCVDNYGLNAKQERKLSSADSPEAYVAALKSLCLANAVKDAPHWLVGRPLI